MNILEFIFYAAGYRPEQIALVCRRAESLQKYQRQSFPFEQELEESMLIIVNMGQVLLVVPRTT